MPNKKNIPEISFSRTPGNEQHEGFVKQPSRASQSRENTKKPTPWEIPSALDAPPPPPGSVHRWLRAETRGMPDRRNMNQKRRWGWEPVLQSEYPDLISDSSPENGNIISIDGLVLGRMSVEKAEKRDRTYRGLAKNDEDWVDSQTSMTTGVTHHAKILESRTHGQSPGVNAPI